MKNIFLLIIASLFVSTTLVGQGNIDGTIMAKTFYDGQVVKLRWAIDNRDAWQFTNQNGFSISRMTTEQNGQALSTDQQFNSKVVLNPNLVPYTSAQWNQMAQTNPVKIAKAALYDSSYDAPISASPNLADAANYVQQEESKMIFAFLAGEQDYDVALGLAQAYVDNTAEANSKYIYTIRANNLNTETAIKTGFTSVETYQPTQYSKLKLTSTEGGNRLATLYWDVDPQLREYSFYNIERSTDSINFTQVNDKPFFFASTAEESSGQIAYQDSLPENNVKYYFRIIGITSFGTLSRPSEAMSVMGIPPRMKLQMRLDEYEFNGEQLLLKWHNLDPVYTDSLVGFNIYSSKENMGPYEKVNNDIIHPSVRKYKDATPLKTGYYKISALDANGHMYTSYSQLVQAPDEDPPMIPIGLSGTFISQSELSLDWEDNTEEDLEGYRVFMSNTREGQYVESTKFPLSESEYTLTIDPTFMVDSIYVKLIAQDLRDNYSEKSEPLAFGRPDAVPPSKPVLAKVMPTPDGLELGWKYSTSDDVAFHILQRRYSTGGSWTDVLKITPEEEGDYNAEGSSMGETNWIDTTGLENRSYDYRMLAMDESYNVSNSDPKSVTPYSSMAEGDVTDFEMDLDEVNLVPNTDYEELISKLEKGGYDVSSMRSTPGSNYSITLKWKYPLNNTVQDFQILRAITGNAMQVYKTISPATALGYPNADVEITGSVGITPLEFTDTQLEGGKRYVYQILVRHKDGSTSKRSATLNKKVPLN